MAFTKKKAQPVGELESPLSGEELQVASGKADQKAKSKQDSRAAKAAKDYQHHPKFSKFQKGK